MKPFTYASVSHVILNHMTLLKIILTIFSEEYKSVGGKGDQSLTRPIRY